MQHAHSERRPRAVVGGEVVGGVHVGVGMNPGQVGPITVDVVVHVAVGSVGMLVFDRVAASHPSHQSLPWHP